MVRQGVDVTFTTCAALTQSLSAARATGIYERKIGALARVGLLIIDDFGLKPPRAPADEDLHDLIAERYERAPILVTSNLDFQECEQAFAATNRLLASATIDRLRHNAYCLELDGLSYRDPKVAVAPGRSRLWIGVSQGGRPVAVGTGSTPGLAAVQSPAATNRTAMPAASAARLASSMSPRSSAA